MELKNTGKKLAGPLFILGLMFSLAVPVMAKEEQGVTELFLFDDTVVSAAKFAQPLSEAPAIMTVITAEEIKEMGARDLKEALKTVPGFFINTPENGLGEFEPVIRGMVTIDKVKVLIDGHSLNDLAYGGAFWTFDNMALDNVKKIEVIRGPGSALYGANAFVGVINIITKEVKDINGYEVKVKAGSYQAKGGSILFGKQAGDFGVTGYFDYTSTDGPKLFIKQDAIGNEGYTNRPVEQRDFNLHVSYKDLHLRTKILNGSRGAYIGIGYAVNDESVIYKNQMFSELSYDWKFNDKMSLLTKLYWDQFLYRAFFEVYPEGTVLNPFPGYYIPFPDGYCADIGSLTRNLGVDVQFTGDITVDNKVIMGAVAENVKGLNVITRANVNSLTLRNYGAIIDISKDLPWLKPDVTRKVKAVYAQDVQRFTDNIILTVGVRHDRYSDFGNSTNPRISLVWKELLPKTVFKANYGTAFRAPSVVAMYLRNNSLYLGNEDLKPEIIRTLDLNVNYLLNEKVNINTTLFRNSINDVIRSKSYPGDILQRVIFCNAGAFKVDGVEVEVEGKVSAAVKMRADYSYQRGRDLQIGQPIQNVPLWKVGSGATIDVNKYLAITPGLLVIGKQMREEVDPRANLNSYALVDLNFLVKEIIKGLEVSLFIENLLNRKYVDPFGIVVSGVPNDYPREGRNFLVKAQYSF